MPAGQEPVDYVTECRAGSGHPRDLARLDVGQVGPGRGGVGQPAPGRVAGAGDGPGQPGTLLLVLPGPAVPGLCEQEAGQQLPCKLPGAGWGRGRASCPSAPVSHVVEVLEKRLVILAEVARVFGRCEGWLL